MIKQTFCAAAILTASLRTLVGADPFETLHQFSGTDGRMPEQAMTLGADGSFYGVTTAGGTGDHGVVFRYSLTEGFSVVADLDATTTGAEPRARLLNIGDGYLYGACYRGSGGPNNGGTVFRITPGAAGASVVFDIPGTAGIPRHPNYLASGEPNVLHILCEDTSGIRRLPLDGSPASVPFTAVGTPSPQSFIRASNGFLYGGTYTGGTENNGVLFRTNGDGTNFTVLHNCESATGIRPIGAMVQAPDGNLYGLMSHAGIPGEDGVLYRLSLEGEFTPIHYFTDFRYQYADLLLASDGMLYGTGWSVGPGGNGNGGIWRIKTNGSGYKALHVFTTGSGTLYPTGRTPVGGLVQGPDGYIYGTTQGGVGSGGAGTIFRLKLNLPPPPVNRAPIAVNDAAVTSGDPVTVNVLINDFDPDGDGLTVSVKTPPLFGTAEVQVDGTVLYTPNPSTYPGADQFEYEISDRRGGKSTASIEVSENSLPALFAPGAYNGLVSLDENLDGTNLQPRGQFQLNVQANGTFTGTLFAKKKRIGLRGKFTPAGTAVATAVMPDRKTADVFFSFQAGVPSTIFAVFYGTEIWTGEAGPTRPSGETKNASYTVQIAANPGIANGPAGHGYATLTIKPNGAVTAVGKLGDGSVLKWTSSLIEIPGEARVIPVFGEPLKDGVFSGLLSSTGNPGQDFLGAARWNRPEASNSAKPYPFGFSGEVDVTVSRFTPPAGNDPVIDLANGRVEIVGTASVPNVVEGTFAIDGKKITVMPNLKAFTINRKTGLVSGTMKNGSKTVQFKGAVNQGLQTGAGHFIIKGETGSAVLGPLIN